MLLSLLLSLSSFTSQLAPPVSATSHGIGGKVYEQCSIKYPNFLRTYTVMCRTWIDSDGQTDLIEIYDVNGPTRYHYGYDGFIRLNEHCLVKNKKHIVCALRSDKPSVKDPTTRKWL